MSASMWAELEDEVVRLRILCATQTKLRDGKTPCESSSCTASMTPVEVARSKWVVDDRGWWFCVDHQDEAEL